MSIHVPGFVIESERSFLDLSWIQICPWSDRLGIVHETVNVIDLVIGEATLNEHVVSTSVWIDPNTSFHSICVCHVLCRKEVLQGLSRTSCNSLIPAIRKKSLVQSIFLVSLLLKEQQDQFVSFRFCEVWHVQFSPGQRARNSTEPTNQSWSNQLLLIVLGSCNQGFDLKSVVVQTLRRQTVETGIQLEFVIIFRHC